MLSWLLKRLLKRHLFVHVMRSTRNKPHHLKDDRGYRCIEVKIEFKGDIIASDWTYVE